MVVSIVAHGCAAFSRFYSQSRIRSSPEFPTGHCQFAGGAGLSIARNGLRIHFESQLRVAQAVGLSDGAPGGTEEVWCGLCGDRGGWCTCGRCMGEGGFPTRPGLAGVKGKVGWARCKTCFGQTVVPCLFCGISDATEWKLWLEEARRHPHQSRKQVTT